MPVELIVNGQAVETQELAADGKVQDLTFDYTPDAVELGGAAHLSQLPHEPGVRRGRRQADPRQPQECPVVPGRGRRLLEAKGEADPRPPSKPAAAEAYDVARQAYAKILAESPPE